MTTRRLKIASHIHSDFSDDSEWTLSRLRKILQRAGFDGALISDHDRTMTEQRRLELVAACRELSDSSFTLVPGVEYQDPDHVVHIPVFGDIPFFRRSPDIGELLSYAAEGGGVSVFAHPRRRRAHERFDPSWVPHLTGIEVWNRKYDGIQPNRWAASTAAHHGLLPFVGLDFHGPRQLFPLTMAVSVDTSAPISATTIVSSIVAGRARSCAFGINATAFTHRYLGVIFSSAEAVRRQTAPLIRRAEHAFRPRDTGVTASRPGDDLRSDDPGGGPDQTGA